MILLDDKSSSRGYFQKGAVESLLQQDYLKGGYAKEIFSLLVLELWHREFLDTQQSNPIEPLTRPSCFATASLFGAERLP
jgi:asparagine synthase (glutamine-hydrolysing)